MKREQITVLSFFKKRSYDFIAGQTVDVAEYRKQKNMICIFRENVNSKPYQVIFSEEKRVRQDSNLNGLTAELV